MAEYQTITAERLAPMIAEMRAETKSRAARAGMARLALEMARKLGNVTPDAIVLWEQFLEESES